VIVIALMFQGYRNKTARHTHTPQPTQPSPSQQQPQQNLSDTASMISNVPDQAVSLHSQLQFFKQVLLFPHILLPNPTYSNILLFISGNEEVIFLKRFHS